MNKFVLGMILRISIPMIILAVFVVLTLSSVKRGMATKAVQQTIVNQDLTYEKDTKPIFQSRCSKCHNERTPGRNWLKYEDAYRKRVMIKFRIKAKIMPPKPNPITEEERETLIKWVDQGAKR